MTEDNDRPSRRKLRRPPKPRGEVRSERVVSFVSRDEFETLTQLASSRGESLSAAIHRILSSSLTEQE